MKRFRSIITIAMAVVLLATAGCVAQQADEVSDAFDLIDLTSDREDEEDVVDAEVVQVPDLEELDTSDIDPVPCSTDCSISTVLGDETKTVGDWYDLLIETSPECVIIWEIDTDNTTPALDDFPSGSGLSFDSSFANWRSRLFGTPLVDGVYNITVTAKVGGEPVDSKSFTLTVLPAGDDDLNIAPANPCDEPLSLSWDVSGTNEPSADEVPHRFGQDQQRSVKLTVTGGKAPYKWTVRSRVKDSHHRYNAGEGDPTKYHRGITNYKYRDPDKPCLTAEEFLDIYGETIILGDEEGDVEEADSFWPDCSPPISSNVKFKCEELGCGGYWYDMSDEMQEQCTNGFDCSGANWQSLTTAQRKACMEHQSEETKEKVHEAMEDAYGTPRYICKWTEDPTWREEGVEIPLYIDKTGVSAHPSSNWDWNPPEKYGNWTPKKSYKTDGHTITFVSDMEFDGPLPVDRQKYMEGEKPVEEHLTFTVTDSCPVPQSDGEEIVVPRIGKASLDVLLEYPNTPITDFEVTVNYSDYNKEGSLSKDKYHLDFLFTDEDTLIEEGMSWQAALEEFGMSAHFGIADWGKCKDDTCSKETDVFNDDEDDVPNVKNIDRIYMRVYAGHQSETSGPNRDGEILPWNWQWTTETDVHWGDLDIKHMYIKSRYWRAHYDDARADDQFNNNVNGWTPAITNLTNLDGWEDINNNGASFGFNRRALLGGKFIP